MFLARLARTCLAITVTFEYPQIHKSILYPSSFGSSWGPGSKQDKTLKGRHDFWVYDLPLPYHPSPPQQNGLDTDPFGSTEIFSDRPNG